MPPIATERRANSLAHFATQPKYAWTHVWSAGELILWDNRCCVHYRTEIDVAQRRGMHSTVIKGEPVQSPWGAYVA
jgi:alpha-ketoglutarate-dependent taurine dioxygenase